MTIRDVRDQIHFSPFDIHLANGRVVTLLTPDHIIISPRNDEFAVYRREVPPPYVGGYRCDQLRRVFHCLC